MEAQTARNGYVSTDLDSTTRKRLTKLFSEQRVPYGAGKAFPKKNSNVPEGEPPRGYVCYRCGKKGEHIISLHLDAS
jgi:hypothetical protein